MLSCTLLLLSCSAADSRPVRLEINIRGSCFPPTSYDTSCVSSLEVGLNDAERAYRHTCSDVSNEYLHLQDLIQPGRTTYFLEQVRARENARIAMRGYYSRGDTQPCVDSALADTRLLFWGESDPVDLDEDTVTELSVWLECQPSCDCRDIADGACGPDLTGGVCAPPKTYQCRSQTPKSCSTREDCYGGAVPCNDGYCEPQFGDVCGECVTDSDCQSQVCVRHQYDDDRAGIHIDEKFCAEICPPVDGSATPCPWEMRCQPLDGVAFTRVGTSG